MTNTLTSIELARLMLGDYEAQYAELLQKVLDTGDIREVRNGKISSIFGERLILDCTNNQMPLLTGKRVYWRAIVYELLMFLSAKTNNSYLKNRGVNIWTQFEKDESGDLGPIHGYQWRRFNAKYDSDETGLDQIKDCIDKLIKQPTSSHIVLVGYNPLQIKECTLPPCTANILQFFVKKVNGVKHLSMTNYQRSCDIFIGLPFDMASFGLLLHIFVSHLNTIEPGQWAADKIIYNLGDVHLYTNHIEQAYEYLSRSPRPGPTLNIIQPISSIDLDYFSKLIDANFELVSYFPHAAIKAERMR